MQTTIHLMRHGEVANPERVLYGRLPGFELSALGHKMAFASAQGLRKEEADLALIAASPLLRTQQTALPAALEYDLPVTADARLVEAWNHFEGADIASNWKQALRPEHWSQFLNPFRPSWGEPYVQILARMRSVIADTLEVAYGREALLVSHQLPIWVVRSWVEGWPLAHLPYQRECSLASITSLVFDDYTLVGCYYWEPAGHLLKHAADLVPGTSEAQNLQ
ncbi:histidine phosphatase family protein [Gleimia sp. 6138-11-ORH1]|uniref:histidine phosphatase family protein n=1 Tax=Gleimia sp. 6138-11-ORH1 TaxID=2973937 RepID=UPI00216AAB71|nr:histidine phosphatase family protein [Gleimia sp. 6138-11-ORH1]MCS4483880.1 histidine phosphatase family protein [Gleimia sp. 6138-11-ORH1]